MNNVSAWFIWIMYRYVYELYYDCVLIHRPLNLSF